MTITEKQIEAAAKALDMSHRRNATMQLAKLWPVMAADALSAAERARDPVEGDEIASLYTVALMLKWLKEARSQLNSMCEEIDGEGWNDPDMNWAIKEGEALLETSAFLVPTAALAPKGE